MKNSVFALAGLLTLAGGAHAQSNVRIYGVVTAGLGYSDEVATPANGPRATSNRVAIDSGQYTQSRFGFRGTEDLGSGLKAEVVIEGGMTIDTGASAQGGATFGRRTTVGLSGSAGELQIGRRKDFIDELANTYASTTRFLPFVSKVHANNMDRVSGERANNMVYYNTPVVKGLRANLIYAFGETAGSIKTGQSLGIGANYDNGPFGIGIGYWQSKLGVVTATSNSSSDQGAASNAGCNTVGLGQPGDTCMKTWMIGSNYEMGNTVLHGTYSQAQQPLITTIGPAAPNFASTFTGTAGVARFAAGGVNNRKAEIIDVGVDHNLGPWKLKAAVMQSRYDFVGASKKGRLVVLALGADYNLSKRTLFYGMIANMRAANMYSPGLTSGGAPGVDNSQNALAAGILHRF